MVSKIYLALMDVLQLLTAYLGHSTFLRDSGEVFTGL